MHANSVKEICSGLMYKAMTEHFLYHTANEIEKDANQFVEEYAKENGLTAHTLSASRWYFQSNEKLLEDGFIELTCKTNKISNGPNCVFSVVDIDGVNKLSHLYEGLTGH